MTNPWLNDDGLDIRFGNEQAKLIAEGRPSVKGMEQELVINIVAVDITDVDVAPLLYKRVGLPQKAMLVSATLYVDVAFTSASVPTLDLGLFSDDGDGTYTVDDVDGIDVDIALTALDSIGATVSCDGAYFDGTDDVVPTVTGGRDLVVSAGYQTTDKYTAGKARLIIKYIKTTE